MTRNSEHALFLQQHCIVVAVDPINSAIKIKRQAHLFTFKFFLFVFIGLSDDGFIFKLSLLFTLTLHLIR